MQAFLAALTLKRHLTVKLRGRTKAPAGAEGAQFLSARGAKPQAHHGPLQRLLERMIEGHHSRSTFVGEKHQRPTSDDAGFGEILNKEALTHPPQLNLCL